MTLLIHEGKKAEVAFSKDGTLPDPSSTDNEEFKIVLTIIKRASLNPARRTSGTRLCDDAKASARRPPPASTVSTP
ncbi:hypothetical protein ACHAWF_005005 [Thalassiosira exigua]